MTPERKADIEKASKQITEILELYKIRFFINNQINLIPMEQENVVSTEPSIEPVSKDVAEQPTETSAETLVETDVKPETKSEINPEMSEVSEK